MYFPKSVAPTEILQETLALSVSSKGIPWDREQLIDEHTSETPSIISEKSVSDVLMSLDEDFNLIIRARKAPSITSEASVTDMLTISEPYPR